MGVFASFEEMGSVREEIREIPGLLQSRPARREALPAFVAHVRKALGLLASEPEILAFAALQWASVMLVFVLWWRGLDFTPEEVTFSLWAVACVAIAALPVGFFTACIGAVHFLRQAGEASTVPACVRLVLPKMGPLWVFTLVDLGFTAMQAVDRMPSRRPRSAASRALSEALYYAWKLATIGILPAILAERTLAQAANESVDLVKKRLAEAALLRIGYSSVCWIIGLAAYALTLVALHAGDALVPAGAGEAFWVAGPLVAALALVQLLVRPIYVLASCDLYHEYRGHASVAYAAHPGAATPPLSWEAVGRSPTVRIAAVAAVALAAWAAYESGALRAFGLGRSIAEMKGVRLGDAFAEASERAGPFDYEPPASSPPGPELEYVQRDGGSVRVAVLQGVVRGISYACRSPDPTRYGGVACHESAERLRATHGERLRVLCARVAPEDPRHAQAPFVRAYDVLVFGIRYVVQHDKVTGFIVREPSDLRGHFGGDLIWHPCAPA